MGGVKMVFGLLTFVTVGMIIGALLQLAFLRRLEESSGSKFPLNRRINEAQMEGYIQLPKGLSFWENDEDARVLRIGFVKPEIVNWSPRIILFHNFLSAEECDYLRAIAQPRLQVSTVVDTKTGKARMLNQSKFSCSFKLISSLFSCLTSGIKSEVRTSSGMFLNSEERKYPMIQAIEKRIAVFSQVPAENGELIQVLRYEKSQFYKPHHDYFSDAFNIKRGGQRIATMLMYLSDNVVGGETYFPSAGNGECSCGGKMMKGLCVKPGKGDAVLFWSMGLDGSTDPNSIHGGCEVLDGEKWSATKWMRQRTSY
ncbi:hypothetical protein AMTRI_Chr06g174130 [Amborella trichopoda]